MIKIQISGLWYLDPQGGYHFMKVVYLWSISGHKRPENVSCIFSWFQFFDDPLQQIADWLVRWRWAYATYEKN